ncbi:unnamed protein product [Urochloa humidicola]
MRSRFGSAGDAPALAPNYLSGSSSRRGVGSRRSLRPELPAPWICAAAAYAHAGRKRLACRLIRTTAGSYQLGDEGVVVIRKRREPPEWMMPSHSRKGRTPPTRGEIG